MLIDSHCHLNYPELADTAAVIARAKAAGVMRMLTISTKRADFAAVKRLAETYPAIHCTIGVHPHDAEDHEDITEAELLAAATHPRVIGIGETGLDFYYEHSPRAQQEALFRRHIAVARTLGVPVIIHSRSADEETIAILRDEMTRGAFRFVIHCFSSGLALALAAVEMGGYVSASGIITFKKSQALRDHFAALPLARLLVETDSPYLAPEPHRGAPCEPAYTAITARKLAQIKGISYETLAAATTENFEQLFTPSVSRVT